MGGGMMKLIVVMIAIALTVGAVPVFAGDGPAADSVFQRISDTIQGDEPVIKTAPVMQSDRHKLRPALRKVTTFQALSDYIKEGSAKARNKSARKRGR